MLSQLDACYFCKICQQNMFSCNQGGTVDFGSVGRNDYASYQKALNPCLHICTLTSWQGHSSAIITSHSSLLSPTLPPPSELPITLSLLVRCPACMTAIPSLATELCLRAQDLPPGRLSMPHHPTLWHNPGHCGTSPASNDSKSLVSTISVTCCFYGVA